ncbi:MAG: calcineurin-like phosphoesterase [Paenibacillus sp.]|jgi:hypothetical protein|nr:calcineurin-like phosphoesterase [Paenibacillus sp.]
MRIAVLGDFHLHEQHMDVSEAAMLDIAKTGADLVVALGDFGSNRVIGSPEGIKQALPLLGLTRTRVRPLLGNHDLQRETGVGDDIQPAGTMEGFMLEAFRLSRSYEVEEYEDFRLFFLCCELQPPESCYQIQECYISSEQYGWIQVKLRERPGVPAIVFSHAPPLGSRLRTVPDVHVRATNSYLDHNHEVHRWIQLVEQSDDLLLWCSAHYHVGHHYPDSIVTVYGTAFVNTGTHGLATRDGKRHTRIIDTRGKTISVSTLDHEERAVKSVADWESSGSNKQDSPSVISISGRSGSRLQLEQVWTTTLGDASPIPGCMVMKDTELCFIADEDGYLWEVMSRYGAVIGSLHGGEPVRAIALAPDSSTLWRLSKNRMWKSELQHKNRFVRERIAGVLDDSAIILPMEAECLAIDPQGSLWVGVRGKLLVYRESKIFTQVQLPVPGESIVQIWCIGHSVWMLTERGYIFHYDPETAGLIAILEGVTACDVHEDGYSAIIRKTNTESGTGLQHFKLIHAEANQLIETELGLDVTDTVNPADIQLVRITSELLLVRLGNNAYVTVIEGEQIIPTLIKRDTISIIKSSDLYSHYFSLAAHAKNGDQSDRPVLEVWEVNDH